jgi:hypothetical protein
MLSAAAVLLTLAVWPQVAQAQIWSRPKYSYPAPVAPLGTRVATFYEVPPNPLPVAAYRFNGPSVDTYTYQYIPAIIYEADQTGTIRPVTVYKFAPVLDYSPGYYLGYDSARFYRN